MLQTKISKDICKVAMSKEQYSTVSNESSNQFSLGSYLASIQANMLPVPVIPSFTCTPLSTETQSQYGNQISAADTETQAMLSIHSRYPAVSQSVLSHETLFQPFDGDFGLTSLTGLNGSHETLSNIGTCATSKYSVHGVGLNPYSSMACSVFEDNLYDYVSLSNSPPFAQDLPAVLVPRLPETVTTLHDIVFSEQNPTDCLHHLTAQPQQMKSLPFALKNENLPSVYSASSCLNRGSDYTNMPTTQVSTRSLENTISPGTDPHHGIWDGKVNSSVGMFDDLELDIEHIFPGQGIRSGISMLEENDDIQNLNIDVCEYTSEFGKDVKSGNGKGFFSECMVQHILDSIEDSKVNSSTSHSSVITCVKSANNHEPENQFSASSGLGNTPSSNGVQQAILPCFSETTHFLLPRGNIEKIVQEFSERQPSKSKLGPWIDDSYSLNYANGLVNQPKKPGESTKIPKKRARPGESTRPRPKDRQQIQDRVKELREIVPNGAKCSIDALLARTVNHMLFLQGVMKYADKIKQADEPKMIGEETGVILRDSPSGGAGATWAYEVAGQTIVCPITIKELNPPCQMLIEILCEDRGSFLEIADSIRGFGLTILKGVMEARDRKIWANFLVEAIQDVTRMEIFLHLVQLLTKTSGTVGSGDRAPKIIDSGIPTFSRYQQSKMPIPITLGDRGR